MPYMESEAEKTIKVIGLLPIELLALIKKAAPIIVGLIIFAFSVSKT